ncbi:MAG TPA: zinc ABC transporter substrate-binding protein [Candidatus Dormibacteraeota bacterium]|nr:zinc ABC transporter substrate-binding protein [Candidatus Dormibacteraeota bacterium]
MRGWRAWLGVSGALLAVTACGGSSSSSSSDGRGGLQIVAAENSWGSIVSQVGGAHVHVTNIIDRPGADPHDYEPTPNDARMIARARYAVINGAGYDEWASKLVEANPASGRLVLTVADLSGKKAGANPHLWYSPDLVVRFIDRVTSDLKRLDAANAADYDAQSEQYQTHGLKAYHDAIAAIEQRHSGTPVGASESLFAPMAPALGLDLVTPPEYLKAVSEGTDISPADKATVQQQVAGQRIRVFVYNRQNSRPDVEQVVDRARARGIPVIEITETPTPAGATFQDWQTRQLQDLLKALGG